MYFRVHSPGHEDTRRSSSTDFNPHEDKSLEIQHARHFLKQALNHVRSPYSLLWSVRGVRTGSDIKVLGLGNSVGLLVGLGFLWLSSRGV